MKHKWTEKDDILVFFVYRCEFLSGYVDEQINKNSLMEYMGFTNHNSIKMRISNFKFLDKKKGGLENFEFLDKKKGGLEHFAKLTEQTYKDYKNMDKARHKKKCLEILVK